jgi:glutathione S-transferase
VALTLYHAGTSTACGRVRLALAEKGQRYDSRHLNLAAGEHRAADFLKVNPSGLVPVLVHDGRTVTESAIVCEYIEEALTGPALAPQDPWLRARMRLWARRIDEGLHDPAIVALTHGIGLRARHQAALAGGEDLRTRLRFVGSPARRELMAQVVQGGPTCQAVVDALWAYRRLCLDMQEALRPGGWLLGVQFSLADIALAPYLARLALMQLDWLWEGLPHVADWWERVQLRSSYRPAIHAWYDTGEREELRAGGLLVREALRDLILERARHPS